MLATTSILVGAALAATIALTADISTPASAPTAFITGKFNVDNGFAIDPFPAFSAAVGSYAPTTDDLVVFVWAQVGSPLFTSATTLQAAGMSGTVVPIEANATDGQSALYVIPRGSGVTVSGGNVSLTVGVSGFGVGQFSAIVGYVHGNSSSTPTSHQAGPFTFFSDPQELTSCVVPTNGVGFAFWANGDSTAIPLSSWFGATKVSASEGSNTTGNSCETSGALQTTPGTYTIGVCDSANGHSGPTSGSMGFIAFA